VLIVVALLGLSGNAPKAQERPRVLFVGNSLTAANDLPGLVSSLSRAAGAPVECVSLTFPDHGLKEHWDRGDAREVIRRGGWSFVVLQQGPSALPESRTMLRQYAKRFDEEIRRVGARTALYMVWPSAARSGDFDAVVKSYATVGMEIGALLLPVGEAWRAAWRRDAGLQFYREDRFHPSMLGSYLAALVIYERLSGRSAEGLAPIVPLPRPALRVLLDASAEVNHP
jgi:hypothetical protein